MSFLREAVKKSWDIVLGPGYPFPAKLWTTYLVKNIHRFFTFKNCIFYFSLFYYLFILPLERATLINFNTLILIILPSSAQTPALAGLS